MGALDYPPVWLGDPLEKSGGVHECVADVQLVGTVLKLDLERELNVCIHECSAHIPHTDAPTCACAFKASRMGP